jgi:hypothetical protein
METVRSHPKSEIYWAESGGNLNSVRGLIVRLLNLVKYSIYHESTKE